MRLLENSIRFWLLDNQIEISISFLEMSPAIFTQCE
jgi:hypothetical protein